MRAPIKMSPNVIASAPTVILSAFDGLGKDLTMKPFVGMLLASVCMATCSGCKPAPELEVMITPSKVTIPDNSERGTLLATVSVRWSDGAPFRGNVRLTQNQNGICQLAGMHLQLGRDTTKADDYTTPVCS